MNNPGDLKPQRILTARRKRAFLSFRRKSDVAWFAVSLIFFSGGATALVVAVMYFGRGQHLVAGTVPGPFPVGAPEMEFRPTASSVVEGPKEMPPTEKKAIEKSPVRAEVTRATPPVARALTPSPRKSPKDKRSPPSTLHIKVIDKWPPLPGQKSSVREKTTEAQKKANEPARRDLSRGATIPLPPKKREYLVLQEAGPFKSETDRNAKLGVEPTESEGEPALQLTYDLNEGTWVQSFVNVRENFSNYSRVQFLYMGDGTNNTLEFKMADAAGTTMGAFWPLQTDKKVWTVVNLPFFQLGYLKGGGRHARFEGFAEILFCDF